MTVKKLYIVLIGLICIAIVFFMFSGEDEAKKNAKKKRNEQLSLLLGGGGSQPKENTGRGQRKTATSSVFDDGDFDGIVGLSFPDLGDDTPTLFDFMI